MSLVKIMKSMYDAVGPELEVNSVNKTVEIKERYLFSKITETYFIFKGYEVNRF